MPIPTVSAVGDESPPQLHAQVADMVTRLSTGDWFTAKVSACGLFTAAYKHTFELDQRALLRAQVVVCCLVFFALYAVTVSSLVNEYVPHVQPRR